MAQKNNNKKVNKEYKNPTKSIPGKILVSVLAACMGLASLGVLIYYLISFISQV